MLTVIPFFYFFINYNNYIFRDSLDVFTFMFEGIIPMLFIFILVVFYLGSFSRTIDNSFIVYSRMRAPVEKILISSFFCNIIISFLVFFTFTFNMFVFAFLIEPFFSFITFMPEVYNLDASSVILDSYTRHTFTNLLAINAITFGLLYSFWVGLHAVLYATIGFFMVILLDKQLLALISPILLYIIGTFTTGLFPSLLPFRPLDVIFPFNIAQQPFWTSLVSMAFLLLICIILLLYTINKKNSLENLM